VKPGCEQEFSDFHKKAARSTMTGMLDGFRHVLEDLGGGLGVTDPVSGAVVAQLDTGRR